MLVGAMLSPLLALALLLWLTHLEETLPQAVHAAQRQPPPPPILTITVDPRPPTTDMTEAGSTVAVPAPDSAQGRAGAKGQAFSRSARLSLGGSTNR